VSVSDTVTTLVTPSCISHCQKLGFSRLSRVTRVTIRVNVNVREHVKITGTGLSMMVR